MAKGFTNIESIRQTMVETSIPSTVKTILNNPYYLFNEKTASIVTVKLNVMPPLPNWAKNPRSPDSRDWVRSLPKSSVSLSVRISVFSR